MEFIRDIFTSDIDFISNMGGILGLCMGISFISGFELVYWFTIKMFINFSGSK